MSRGRGRGNGEGSLYPVPGGWRGYVWVTGPDGTRRRKYVKAITYDAAQSAWLKLRSKAESGPIASNVPKLKEFIEYWLREVVDPNLAPKTREKYALLSRLYINPWIGTKRLDRLQVRDIRTWLNRLRTTCQCCFQKRDAMHPPSERRCCAAGKCCRRVLSDRSVKDVRDTLRAALGTAVEEELVARNVAAMVRLPTPRRGKVQWWSAQEARTFLESARSDNDPLYAAYVLILVLGLRRGEALGLAWADVNFDAEEIHIRQQLQRVGGELSLRATKTASSAAVLPLPGICFTALRLRAEWQARDRAWAADTWMESGLVLTTGHGTPYDPRNFNRQFASRCQAAGVRRIRVHDTRRTCATLLVALDVHPRVAMQVLRHSQISMTMEVYSEVSDQSTRDALRRLGEQLDT